MSNANPRPRPFEEQLKDKWKCLFYAMLLSVVIVVAYFLPIDVSAARGLLIGGICGILGHYMATRIAELTISTDMVGVDELEDYLSVIGYVKIAGRRMYEPDMHKSLIFKAQNIYIEIQGEHYLISGPIYIMRKMKRKFCLEEIKWEQ